MCLNLRASLLCTSYAVSVVLASVAVDGMTKGSVLTEWRLYPGPGANYMMRGQYNVHTYVHILCGETHRDVYGVSSMEKLTSVMGVARATQCVC